mmetsp:Transcript_73385/g.195500  ORF Transcript_73385/g.195500 Transcript_73385/m.195500 type:complete len:284 (-) Transcript_73385:67-918(-)
MRGKTAVSSFLWTICLSSAHRNRLGSSVHSAAFIANSNFFDKRLECPKSSSILRPDSRSSKYLPRSNGQSWFRTLFVLKFARSMATQSSDAKGEEVDPGQIEGTNLRILKYPHPLLRAKIEDVEVFDDNLRQIAKEMLMIMYATNGVGLAAPQVGINKKIMVFNIEGTPNKWMKEVIYVNPRITVLSDTTDIKEEGCLSFPGMSGPVERHKWIKLEAFNLSGRRIRKKLEGWEARVFQHEFDHLNGRLYVDRLLPDFLPMVKPALNKLIADHRRDFPDLPEAL